MGVRGWRGGGCVGVRGWRGEVSAKARGDCQLSCACSKGTQRAIEGSELESTDML